MNPFRSFALPFVLLGLIGCSGKREPLPSVEPNPFAGLTCDPALFPASSAPPAAPGERLPASEAGPVLQAYEALRAALNPPEEPAIVTAVCQGRVALGRYLGVPEEAADYIPENPDPLTDAEAISLIAVEAPKLIGTEPWVAAMGSTSGNDVTSPLRSSCGALRLEALAARLNPAQADALLASVKEGAAYLTSVQRPDGLFPFPDLSDEFAAKQNECEMQTGAAKDACTKELARDPARLIQGVKNDIVARGESLDDYFQNGWIIRDVQVNGDGGDLQYDNGICGEAMLVAGIVLGDDAVLEAGRRAADWAAAQKLSTNWNYNAFSVRLMALYGRRQGDAALTSAAVEKARFGVLPGELPTGRWGDQHNAKTVYHAILMKSLTALALAIAPDDPEHDHVMASVDVALLNYATELVSAGGTEGDGDGLVALVEMRARRPLTDMETQVHVLLRANAGGGTSLRNPNILDELLATQGKHPLFE